MHQPTIGGRWPRRAFVAITVLSFTGLMAWADRLLCPPAGATPAKGERVDPDDALRRLMEGNDRFVKGLTKRRDLSVRRMALVEVQFPFAALLACADSRVSPEYVFDADLGDLFITRTAGNYLSPDDLATLEYAVHELGTPLLVALGRASRGVVKATVLVAENHVVPKKHGDTDELANLRLGPHNCHRRIHSTAHLLGSVDGLSRVPGARCTQFCGEGVIAISPPYPTK